MIRLRIGAVGAGLYLLPLPKISRVTRVDRGQYEQDVREGRVLFEEPHGGNLYYATEHMVDATDDPLNTNKVMWLEGKVYP